VKEENVIIEDTADTYWSNIEWETAVLRQCASFC